MKTTIHLAALLATVILTLPHQAAALSVRQYESQTKQQRAEFVVSQIEKIVADTAKADPALSKAIHDYFYVIPQGQPGSLGLIAFEGALLAAEKMADQGKLDPNQAQIESLLLGLVKRDVISKQQPKDR